jgi:hypothetical protein
MATHVWAQIRPVVGSSGRDINERPICKRVGSDRNPIYIPEDFYLCNYNPPKAHITAHNLIQPTIVKP